MSRRAARELALMTLVEAELGEAALEEAWSHVLAEGLHELDSGLDSAELGYARELAQEVSRRRAELDAELDRLVTGWSRKQMSSTDRNVLRLAVHEILHHPEVPLAAAIDEAVDIAGRFGGDESGRFVNGVLGKLARERQGKSQGGC